MVLVTPLAEGHCQLMGTRAAFAVACFAGTLVVASAVASCGARTGLLGEPDELFQADSGDGSVLLDQFIPDRFLRDDFTEPDAPEEDALDELPFLDVGPPDGPVFNPCPDAAATLIYVISQTGTLYSYDPPTATFTPIGIVSCPGAGSTMPFSMAIDREGTAYVEFADENSSPPVGANLYRVSTKTASCTPTAYNPAANDRMTYGMGFVANAGDGGDAGETLFIAEQPNGVNAANVLATIDTTTFAVGIGRTFSSNVQDAELTGTGDGRLFAYYNQTQDPDSNSSAIGQIDPATGQVLGQDAIQLEQGGGWAFGFWGGAFYVFTAPLEPSNTHTIVSRFDPVDRLLSKGVASLETDVIVGAGVSTCAPSQ